MNAHGTGRAAPPPPAAPGAAPRPYGLLAQFDDADGVIAAARRVRDAGYVRWDVHTPYPLHGLDEAMGLKRSPLPILVLGGGVAGAAIALHMQWWTNAVDYPYLISGKPFFSLPANIPILFELAVLLASFAAFFGMLVLNRLPRLHHPTLTSEGFRKVTTDGFFLAIEASDPRYARDEAETFLRSLGAAHVEVLYE